LRLRLLVYGVLAACVALVLAAMPRAEEQAKPIVLHGSTARGAPVELVVYDGHLHSFSAMVAVHCPDPYDFWQHWDWQPIDGLPQVSFHQDGSRLSARERVSNPRESPPSRYLSELRGKVSDDGHFVRGEIHGRAVYGANKLTTVCEATVPFRAR
jgi:hypothetical protein